MKTVTVNDLQTGDQLLRLGGIGFPQLLDPQDSPVLIADVRPPVDSPPSDEKILEIVTSTGTIYARHNTPAVIHRQTKITPTTVLLISRRPSLHAQLTQFGSPIIRRTPIHSDRKTDSVTPNEWSVAPLIIIDGYLAISTLQALKARKDLPEREEIIMVGTDPDDIYAEARQKALNIKHTALLPYDKSSLQHLLRTAVKTFEKENVISGITAQYQTT